MKTTLIRRQGLVVALVLSTPALSGLAYAQWASDSTFNVTDWSCSIIPPPNSGNLSSAVCTQDLTDGNSAPSRKTLHTYGGSSAQVYVGHIYQPASAIYDPSVQGAIVGLRYSYDLKSDIANNAAYHLLVFQDSTFYQCWVGPNIDNSMLGGNTWISLPQNPITYTSANCVKLAGRSTNINPDFSCKGKPIQFGFDSGISSGYNNRVSSIDNWKVDLIKGEPCQSTCGAINKSQIRCNEVGGFTYTFEVTNNSTKPTQYILLSPPPGATYTVSPNVLNTPLNPGQPTTVTVNIANAPPTGNVCVDVLLADEKGKPCCKLQTCLPAPDCPCLRRVKETIECGSGGGYTYTVQLQNLSGAAIQQIFVIPVSPAGVTVTQSMFPVTLGTLGSQATIQVTINAPPGSTVVLLLSPSGAEPLCCSLEVRFTVPEQGQC